MDSNFARPNYSCETAHPKNTETSSVAFSIDGTRLASRGGDDTVKCKSKRSFKQPKLTLTVWEIKSMRKPIAVASDLGNIYPETNLIFSPDNKSILTGTAVRKGSGDKGAIVFLSSADLSEQRRVPVGDGSVVRVFWHSRINQVCCIPSSDPVLTHAADLRKPVNRRDSRPLLPSLFDSRRTLTSQKDAQNSRSRYCILLS